MALELWECFEQAADLLERAGWVQGTEKEKKYGLDTWNAPEDFTYCLLGACREVCPETEPGKFARGLGFNTGVFGESVSKLIRYNDHRNREARHVINRLRRYAKKLRREHEKGESNEA